MTIGRLVGEGDLAVVRWRAQGTDTVADVGMPGTGRSFDVEGTTMFRFDAGRIVEEWSLIDRFELMRQLGVLPE